jgi:hypothetical protein
MKDMFARGPPKVYLKLREGLVADKIFEGLAEASFIGARGLVMALLTGDAAKDSHTYSEIVRLLRRHRAGRVVRITVAAAEGVAVADFGMFVSLKSIAQHDRFIVWLKARNRSGEYVVGRAGKVISKKVTMSAALDQYA